MKRGGNEDKFSKADGVEVAVKKIGLGGMVDVEVLVEIGKISVIAGKGWRVVVGVSAGVAEEVEVPVGVLGTPEDVIGSALIRKILIEGCVTAA